MSNDPKSSYAPILSSVSLWSPVKDKPTSSSHFDNQLVSAASTSNHNQKVFPPKPMVSSKTSTSVGRRSPSKKTVAFGMTTREKKKDNTNIQIQTLNKQVTQQASELSDLKAALQIRDAQIDKLTQLVEKLVECQSEKSATPPLTADQSAQGKIDAGTSIGSSMIQANGPKKKDKRITVAQKLSMSPPSQAPRFQQRQSLADVSLSDQSPPKIDARDLALIDGPLESDQSDSEETQQHFFHEMISLAQKYLDKGNDEKVTQKKSHSRSSQWSLLLNEAENNESLNCELRELGMKYLPDKQLSRLAKKNNDLPGIRRTQPQPHTPPSAMHKLRQRQTIAWERQMTSVCGSPGFSIATEEFLGRHGLIEGERYRNNPKIKYIRDKYKNDNDIECNECYGNCNCNNKLY